MEEVIETSKYCLIAAPIDAKGCGGSTVIVGVLAGCEICRKFRGSESIDGLFRIPNEPNHVGPTGTARENRVIAHKRSLENVPLHAVRVLEFVE